MFRMKCLSAVVVMCALVAANVRGQEQETAEGGQTLPPLKTEAIIMSGSADDGSIDIQSIEFATPMAFSTGDGARMFFSSPMMGGGIQSDSIGWLKNEDILTELDIVDEQREKLQQLRESVQKRRQDFMKTVQELPAEKRIDFIREFSTLLSANVDEQVKDILLPHQLKRFEQIRLQTQMRSRGLRSMENDELAKLLGITDQQREELRKKQAEVEEELRKKVEQLRKEALDEVLTVLTPAQRDKLKELVGKDYEFRPTMKFPGTSPPAKSDIPSEKR